MNGQGKRVGFTDFPYFKWLGKGVMNLEYSLSRVMSRGGVLENKKKKKVVEYIKFKKI